MKTIELKINNKITDLYNDVTISIKLLSPIFYNLGETQADFTMPFSLPITKQNSLALKHIEQPNAVQVDNRFDYELSVEHTLLYTGHGYIESIDGQSYNISLQVKYGGFFDNIREMKLPDIDDSTNSYVYTFASWFDAAWYLKIVTYGNNPNYVGLEVQSANLEQGNYRYINLYDESAKFYETAQVSTNDPDKRYYAAFWRLKTVLARLFGEQHFFFLEDPGISALPDVYIENPNQRLIDGGVYEFSMKKDLPNVSVTEFLVAVQKTFNVIFTLDETTRNVSVLSVESLITDNNFVDFSKKASDRQSLKIAEYTEDLMFATFESFHENENGDVHYGFPENFYYLNENRTSTFPESRKLNKIIFNAAFGQSKKTPFTGKIGFCFALVTTDTTRPKMVYPEDWGEDIMPWWENTAKWKQNYYAETTHFVLLDEKEIANFDFTKKYRIGDNLYFAKELQISINQKGIQTKATMAKVLY